MRLFEEVRNKKYVEDELFEVYQQLLKSYLISMVSIKELDIPYIQYHPIIKIAVEIKVKISKLKRKLKINKQTKNIKNIQ